MDIEKEIKCIIKKLRILQQNSGSGGVAINDTTPSLTEVYSSTKVESLLRQPVVSVKVVSYTLEAADKSFDYIRVNTVTASTVTIPPFSSVPNPIPTYIYVEQMGAGTVSILAGVGVTLNTTAVKTPFQNGVITIVQVATNVWNIIGGTV